MNKIAAGIFLIVVTCSHLYAQILPKEGSTLNYRIIGFSFPEKQGVSEYKIEIALGNYNNVDLFKRNIVTSFTGEKNKIIGEIPSFGKQYTWRIVSYDKKSAEIESELHHFSTGIIPEVDIHVNRLRIVKQAEKYKDAYVFLDQTKVLYDMMGHPIWYLPNKQPYMRKLTADSATPVTDLKLSPCGTITFLNRTGIFEISYNGDVLWSGPDNELPDSTNENQQTMYHHEFSRLANGNYMAMGYEDISWKLSRLLDTNDMIRTPGKIYSDSERAYEKRRFGTVIEYDKSGKKIWVWRASKYIMESDLANDTTEDKRRQNLHDNAFFFDENNKEVYISFRNINRIIKVKYPEGKVLYTFGETYSEGTTTNKKRYFCAQHACRLSQEGYLYLFNNNDCKNDLPTIVMMQEPQSSKDTLKKIWEYKCTVIDVGINSSKPSGATGGGSVSELPDRSILVCMGYYTGKLFIVNKNKEILWTAILEKWSADEKKWDSYRSYRASMIINRKELERLIWNEKSN